MHTEHKKLLLDGGKKNKKKQKTLPLLISVQTNLNQQVTELLQKALAYKSMKVTCDESLRRYLTHTTVKPNAVHKSNDLRPLKELCYLSMCLNCAIM